MALTKVVDGVTVELSSEEEARVRADWEAADLKAAAIQYKIDRRDAYPPLKEQLDTIYHSGLDVWKAEIALIKAQNPKPE